MELRHLRYFRAVAEELHFGRAAALLHIAQPPLSQQVRQLEQEIGVQLLTRTTRSVELTPAGEAYLQRVVTILEDVDSAARLARRIAGGTEGQLTIGCVGSATYSLLPELVRAVGESLPGVEVIVRGEMLAPAQAAAVLSGDLDIGLLRPPVRHAGIATTLVRRDRLLVALPAGHRLSTRNHLRMGDLRDEDFVVHAGNGQSVMSNVVAKICSDAGFAPRIRQEVTETSTLVMLVAAGLGVAVMPAPASTLGIATVRYVPLLPTSLAVDLVAAYRADGTRPVVERVLEVVTTLGSKAAPPQ